MMLSSVTRIPISCGLAGQQIGLQQRGLIIAIGNAQPLSRRRPASGGLGIHGSA